MRILLIMILLVLPSCLALETAHVIKVIDGDTVTLDNGNKVRFIGIDTPERGQCYYKEAKSRLNELVLNKEIKLEKDITNKDKYNRLLRYVYLEDQFINDLLVEEGYARAYYYKPDIRNYPMIKQSEKQAKKHALGMWKDCLYNLNIWEKLEIFFLRLTD